ncbi:glutathione S-transferase T3-like [Chenopodium quinoa]|uniref:glutathione S-transferase T3-like n=1 Tax=Chenopodium quinoa TaxID=63459 RepID=UPI000B792049|nr:glutathione S-transferase T3-like [Chenopodium quinoa]
MTYENLSRDTIRGSSTQEESLPSRLGDESQTSQTEADSEEINNQSEHITSKLKWTQVKDIDLCKSLTTISKDPVKGNDQTKDVYWKNIGEYYNQWRKEDPEIPVEKIANHWYKMSGDVNKFNGYYIQLKESHLSVHNEEDIINKTMELFSSRNKDRKFPYLHAWQILRNDPKWQEFSRKQGGPRKKSKVRSSAGISSSSHHDTTQTDDVEVLDGRPIGQKAAKEEARRKKNKKKANDDDTWTKFEDLAKKRLSLMEDHIRQSYFEILCKDTSNTDERARKNHEQVCELLRAKYGMS